MFPGETVNFLIHDRPALAAPVLCLHLNGLEPLKVRVRTDAKTAGGVYNVRRR